VDGEELKGIIFVSRCIAATIVVEILFAAKQAKRLERKACLPPNGVALIFFQKIRYTITL